MDTITELAQRLSALKETSDPTEARKLLQWVRSGGLESLKPTLTAFLRLTLEPTYHILALPLLATARLTKEQQVEAKQYAITHGYQLFAPSNVETIKLTGPSLCTFLYAAFKELLLNEHEAALRLYEESKERTETPLYRFVYMPVYVRAGPDAPLADRIVKQAQACMKPDRPIKQILFRLIADIYHGRDQDYIFGGFGRGGGRGPSGPRVSEDEERLSTAPEPSTPAIPTDYLGRGIVRHSEIRPNEDYVVPNYKNVTALILLNPINYTYLGHIYIWPSMDYLRTADAIGIRTSLVNLVSRPSGKPTGSETPKCLGSTGISQQTERSCRNVSEIGQKLVAAMLTWAQQNRFELLRIQQPVDVMAKLAGSLGFKKDEYDNYWILVQPHVQRITQLAFPQNNYEMMNYGCTFPWFEPGAELTPAEVRERLTEALKDPWGGAPTVLTPGQTAKAEEIIRWRNKEFPYYYWPSRGDVNNFLYDVSFRNDTISPDEIIRTLGLT